jgi:hypothetical protein
MVSSMKKRIGILTGGGDCPWLNGVGRSRRTHCIRRKNLKLIDPEGRLARCAEELGMMLGRQY